MSLRIDTSEYFSGLVIGQVGLGVLGSAIPSAGDSGASFLYNDLSLPADAGKEIRGQILTWPSAGNLLAYEDGSFEFSGAPDGAYSFTYRLYVDGVDSGTGAVALTVGAGNGVATGAPSVVSITAPSATAAGTTVGNGAAAGVPASLSIAALTAVGIGTSAGAGLGVGSPSPIALSAPSAIAIGTSIINGLGLGSPASVAIIAASGYAYTGDGFVRAPSGSGPLIISSRSIRLSQSLTSRPRNIGGTRH